MIRFQVNRYVPLTTRICIIFGGFKSQFGWAFFGFGMIFFWAFAMNSDLSEIFFNENTVTTEGHAIRWQGTNASENNAAVYENYFVFSDEEGIEHEGRSYATGQAVSSGETLIIEYPEGKPQYARIKGMRRKMFSPIVLFVVIFPLTGLIFILLSLRRSRRAIKLLKKGVLTEGELIAKEATNTKINNRTVYRMVFRYTDDIGNEYTRKEKTPATYLLQDQKKEKLLYLRSKPSYSIMLDSLPASAVISNEEKVKSCPLRNAILILIFPLATIVGHGIHILITYFS